MGGLAFKLGDSAGEWEPASRPERRRENLGKLGASRLVHEPRCGLDTVCAT